MNNRIKYEADLSGVTTNCFKHGIILRYNSVGKQHFHCLQATLFALLLLKTQNYVNGGVNGGTDNEITPSRFSKLHLVGIGAHGQNNMTFMLGWLKIFFYKLKLWIGADFSNYSFGRFHIVIAYKAFFS